MRVFESSDSSENEVSRGGNRRRCVENGASESSATSKSTDSSKTRRSRERVAAHKIVGETQHSKPRVRNRRNDSPARPGRPRAVKKNELWSFLETRASSLLYLNKNGVVTVKPRGDGVWDDLAQATGLKKSASSWHTYVTCNQDDVRTKLRKLAYPNSFSPNVSHNSTACSLNSTQNLQEASEPTTIESNFVMLKSELENLTEDVWRWTNKQKKKRQRRKVLIPGKWENVITDKIWFSTNQPCGFMFKDSYVSLELEHGNINGIYFKLFVLVKHTE